MRVTDLNAGYKDKPRSLVKRAKRIEAMASKGSTTPIVAQGVGGGQGILQQMLPMMALSALGKSASDGSGNAGGAGGVKGLILLDVASRALPFIGGLITTWIHGRIRSRTSEIVLIKALTRGL